MPESVENDLAFAHALADEADKITREAYVPGATVEHQIKPDGTPVSAVDQEVENALLELVRRHRPEDAFLGEEVGAHGHGHRRWIVDGIDGTSAFVTGEPLWGTLIALVQDNSPVLGVGTSPAQGRRWWAASGHGAWSSALDSRDTASAQPMTVAQRPRGHRPKAWVEDLADDPTRTKLERLLSRVEHTAMTTHPGFMVAAGELDLAVVVAGGPWDFAAVMPMVWEAGGQCLDLDGVDVRVPLQPMLFAGGMERDEIHALLGG